MEQSRAELWDFARSIVLMLHTVFGKAGDLVAIYWTKGEHRSALSFVRGLEALARELILAEACDLLQTQTAPHEAARGKTRPRRPQGLHDQGQRSPYGSFRVLGAVRPRANSPGKQAVTAQGPAEDKASARGFALRVVRLERVLSDPHAVARRCARGLFRRAKARRSAPPPAGRGFTTPIASAVREAAQIRAQAWDAWAAKAAPNSS